MITDKLVYVDEYTAKTTRGDLIRAKDIHKSTVKVRGIILHSIAELITNIKAKYTIISNNMFYKTEKQLLIKKYTRRIVKNNMKTIKVAGYTCLIEHDDDSLRVKNLTSGTVYAVLYEWRNLIFYKEKSYHKMDTIYAKV